MATNNRERVGQALDLLAAGLEQFIDRTVGPTLPAGKDWTLLLAAKDAGAGINRSYDRGDLQSQLRMLTERFGHNSPFDERLSRTEKSFASELREVRNRWAHSQAFTFDDAYRALDSAERLLRAAGDVASADEIKASRADLARREYDAEQSRGRSRTAMSGLESVGLPSWREVLVPHPDIAAGRYAASEFAADLHEVARGSGAAAEEYADPVQFFGRTYVTAGLRELLRRAVARISGDRNADPVINLQTNFGGGKTHSMLAVWHLVSGQPAEDYPQEIQELLTGVDVSAWGTTVSRVALVGNEIPPGQPVVKDDGTEVRTLWGELAWQLGGRAAYDVLAGADRTSTNPGALLKELLAAHAPCVILIDEWVAYARQLAGNETLCGGTFDTQFTFAQTLTEAVSATPGALLLVSIPASDIRADADGRDASDLEIGGVHGRQALARLQNVVGRTAYEWRPASSQESFEIVRRRLFVDPDGDARHRIAATARAFAEFYQRHTGEFPAESRDASYEARIRAAFPIHPELFDRLYTDWSSLERFQRTRGVLRLMSAVLHTLDASGDPSPLIMPGSLPLDAVGVRDEIAKYLDDNWKPIVDADIDGIGSVPARIDEERPLFGNRALTRRIARALFLGSAATLKSAHKGIERQRLFLGVAQPGDTVGNFGSSLQLLSDRATFLFSEGERYWYDTQPSLNRKAAEKAESLEAADVWEEIVARLRRREPSQPGLFADVAVAPSTSADVDEPSGARLVILHPRLTHTGKGTSSDAWMFSDELMTSRGSAPRDRRNLLVALGADSQRYAELESAVRQHLAWRDMSSRTAELDLTPQNEAMVRRRLDESNRAVDSRIPTTYIWAFYPVQLNGARPAKLVALKIDGTESRLAIRASARLDKEQILVGQLGAQSVRTALDQELRSRWNDGRLSVGELWSFYARYPYLYRLRNRRVLDDAVSSVLDELEWTGGGFALATGYDAATGDFDGLVLPGATASFGAVLDTTLLVAPELALRQQERTEAAIAADPGTSLSPDAASATPTGSGRRAPSPPPQAPRTRNVSYDARLTIQPHKDIAAQLRDASIELLAYLAAGSPDSLDITLTVHAERIDGFDDGTVRTVTENGTTLGFAHNRFEDG